MYCFFPFILQVLDWIDFWREFLPITTSTKNVKPPLIRYFKMLFIKRPSKIPKWFLMYRRLSISITFFIRNSISGQWTIWKASVLPPASVSPMRQKKLVSPLISDLTPSVQVGLLFYIRLLGWITTISMSRWCSATYVTWLFSVQLCVRRGKLLN